MENNEKSSKQRSESADTFSNSTGSMNHIFQAMWRSPWGILGVVVTTISFTLTVIGLLGHILGFIDNPYIGVYVYLILPGIGTLGVIIIIIAAYFRRKEWRKYGIDKPPLVIDLGNPKHRMSGIRFIILSVIAFIILIVMSYEGYHFTDSPYFCGMVCHQIMEPEYTVYKRSSHAKVSCVECHIGSGANWYVRAKLSGLRQVVAAVTDSYSRPIPVPVEHLRPARDICEQCHWPEKFHGKRVKTFAHFSNKDQVKPQVNEIALHVGGPNPETDAYEGIHWHVSKDVKVRYLAVDQKRTQIAKVKVTRFDGSEDEFVNNTLEVPKGVDANWRIMDCIDCHNRPTHKYDNPEERVDFGLRSKKISPDVPGIREDSLIVLTQKYSSRDEAKKLLVGDLLALQAARDAEGAKMHETAIRKAGDYLLETYLGNIWPLMNIGWGEYKEHLGHQFEEEGYGCFRCHNENLENTKGETISQDCALCHDEP
jgi:NapC/NirT cytochrome c family, N-terminal region